MQILVTYFGGQGFTLDVQETDTIDDVKSQITIQTGLPVKAQQLLLHCDTLGGECTLADVKEGCRTLSDYQIQNEARIHVLGKSTGTFMIYVEYRQETVSILIEAEDTVDYVKSFVEGRFGIPPENQRLMFQGQQLQDEQIYLHEVLINDATLILDYVDPAMTLDSGNADAQEM